MIITRGRKAFKTLTDEKQGKGGSNKFQRRFLRRVRRPSVATEVKRREEGSGTVSTGVHRLQLLAARPRLGRTLCNSLVPADLRWLLLVSDELDAISNPGDSSTASVPSVLDVAKSGRAAPIKPRWNFFHTRSFVA